jgi:hypothetical protein
MTDIGLTHITQQLGQKFSTLGFELLGLGVGSFLVVRAVLGVRKGTISGNYTISTYKRSEDAAMFWTSVVFNGAFGAFLFVFAFGCILGLWSS